MTDIAVRLVSDVEHAVTAAAPTERGLVRAALTLEAIANAIEGDLPVCLKQLVLGLSRDLERAGFTSPEPALLDRKDDLYARFAVEVAECLRHRPSSPSE